MNSFPLAAGGGWYISLCLCVRFLEVASLGSRDVAKLCHGHGVVALLLLFACCGLVLCSPAIARVRLVLGIVVLAGAGWCVSVCGCSSILSICWLAFAACCWPMPAPHFFFSYCLSLLQRLRMPNADDGADNDVVRFFTGTCRGVVVA
jgi:hypothetical protein